MRINEGKVLLLLSGILVGIFTSMFIINTSLNPTKYLSYQDYEKMSLESNQLETDLRGINKEVIKIRYKLNNYENSDDQNKTITDSMKKELNELKTAYGLLTVEGTGVKITINDLHKKVYKGDYDLSFSTVHNTDLLNIVKDLKNAGAEAISINGKRIIETTSITCEGPVIMINGQYIVPPFRIYAIGNSDALKYAMTTDPSFYTHLDIQARGLIYKVEKAEIIRITGVENAITPKYSKSME
jgi:uncharacterized protein YlxW (UPF0749 family)